MLFGNSFILLDLEYTAWEGSILRKWSGKNEYREIIDIGALFIVYSNNEYKIKNIFNQLVVPKINKDLSEYIISLTGITNEEIQRKGITFKDAFNKLVLFLEERNMNILQYGTDSYVIEENLNINSIKYDLKDLIFII